MIELMRQFGRWLVLALCLAVLGPWMREAWQVFLLPAFSPFVAAGGALAARTLGVVTLFALPVLVLVLLVPRGFCRYVCPIGLTLELAGRLRGKNARRVPEKFPPLNFWFALLTLGGPALAYPLILSLDPLPLLNGFHGAWHSPHNLTT